MINENEINRIYLILKIIWSGIMLFLLFYLFLGLYLADNFQSSIKENTFLTVRTILYIFTFINLIGSIYMRKFILSEKFRYQQPGLTLEQKILKKYFIANVINLAILESIGIFGLILFLLGKNKFDLYILILISMTFIFIFSPKKDEIINLIKEYQDKTNRD